MGLLGCEWELCGRQHIMGADDASQAMPQAMGASGTVRRATIATMAWMRRIAERLPQRVLDGDEWATSEKLANCYSFPQKANVTAPMRKKKETAWFHLTCSPR